MMKQPPKKELYNAIETIIIYFDNYKNYTRESQRLFNEFVNEKYHGSYNKLVEKSIDTIISLAECSSILKLLDEYYFLIQKMEKSNDVVVFSSLLSALGQSEFDSISNSTTNEKERKRRIENELNLLGVSKYWLIQHGAKVSESQKTKEKTIIKRQNSESWKHYIFRIVDSSSTYEECILRYKKLIPNNLKGIYVIDLYEYLVDKMLLPDKITIDRLYKDVIISKS